MYVCIYIYIYIYTYIYIFGGLSAHAMAQLGVVMVWMLVRDANALVGFGTGDKMKVGIPR